MYPKPQDQNHRKIIAGKAKARLTSMEIEALYQEVKYNMEALTTTLKKLRRAAK
jgi:hypothetical protein